MQSNQAYKLVIITFLSLLLVLSGCSKTESENVTSQGIRADIEVVSGGHGSSEVKVELRVGDGLFGTLLELSNSDRLLAHANGVTQQLGKDEDLFEIMYKTTFNIDDEGTQFRVELQRDEGVSAPNSIVTLPLSPNVTMPANDDTVALGSDLTVAWEPAFTQDSMSVRFIIECRGTNGSYYSSDDTHSAVDNGVFRINTSEISSIDPEVFDDMINCPLEIIVYRKRRGSLDPGYGEGGRIVAIQRRAVTVQLEVNPQN